MHTLINYRSGCAALRKSCSFERSCIHQQEITLPALAKKADDVSTDPGDPFAAHDRKRENENLSEKKKTHDDFRAGNGRDFPDRCNFGLLQRFSLRVHENDKRSKRSSKWTLRPHAGKRQS